MSPGDVRSVLREATRARHQTVDRLFSAFDMATPEGYGQFLRAQSGAFLPVEAAVDLYVGASGAQPVLPDWASRRRGALLLADLADLGLTAGPEVEPPRLKDAGGLLGAVYVLEGSRLGGAVLRRGAPPGAPTRFLNQPGGGSLWRALIVLINRHLTAEADRTAAIEAAHAVFACFERAAEMTRRPGPDVRVH